MIGAAGTRANQLDALRDLLVLYPGEWHYVRTCESRNGAQSLKVNLRKFSTDEGTFRTAARVRLDGRYKVYAKWLPNE